MRITKNHLLSTFVVTILAAVIFGFSINENPNKEIITVRTIEVMSGLWDNSIVTAYPNGDVERIELEKMKHKDFTINMVKVNGHLNSIISKGYDLNAVSGGASDGIIVTTYTFTKD